MGSETHLNPPFVAHANLPRTAELSRRRPPDVARHAAVKVLAAIVDLNQRTLAFKPVVGGFRHACMIR